VAELAVHADGDSGDVVVATDQTWHDLYPVVVLVAVAQTEPKLADPDRNLEACLVRLGEAGAAGCSLVVLTEFALSGYMFESEEEAATFAEEVPGPSIETLRRPPTRALPPPRRTRPHPSGRASLIEPRRRCGRDRGHQENRRLSVLQA
jgi:hypothetical protein